MPKKSRPLERSQGVHRDATLVIIASEDKYAVGQYFEFFRSTRVQFRVLGSEDNRSSPDHVINRLKDFKKEFQFGEGDQFWFVADIDHWSQDGHIQNLVQVLRLCRQAQIGVALSNPCFELWILLHFADFPTEDINACADVIRMLREACGEYNKRRVFNLQITNNHVRNAIARSKARFDKANEIPSHPQTAVHLIIEDLVDRGVISIPNDQETA